MVPSFKSSFIYFMMKNRHLLHFRLKRDVWGEHTSIPQFREECEKTSGVMGKLPANIRIEPLTIQGLSAEWVIPPGGTKDKVILYTIGGGYVSGSCNDHRALVAKIANCSGVSILLFNHRLAPEHPFPAALEDSITTYSWLLSQGVFPANLMIVGESAGGGLCLATLLALRDKGIHLPKAAVAISPWTDLKLTGESHRTKAKVCLSPEGMSEVCCKYYIGEDDPYNPYISPLYGELHDLPPILINVGEYETLLDDSIRFAEKAVKAGVDVTLRVGEGMIHCYPLLSPLFPEATEAMEEICAFVKKHINS